MIPFHLFILQMLKVNFLNNCNRQLIWRSVFFRIIQKKLYNNFNIKFYVVTKHPIILIFLKDIFNNLKGLNQLFQLSNIKEYQSEYGQHSWLQDPVRSWVLYITIKFYMAQSGISKLNHLLLNTMNGTFEISTIKERHYVGVTTRRMLL